MHVDRLQGIQVQLDNTWGIIVGLYVLQKHKCPYGTGELRFVHLQYSRPSCDTTHMYMPWNIFTTQFHSFLLWVVYSFTLLFLAYWWNVSDTPAGDSKKGGVSFFSMNHPASLSVHPSLMPGSSALLNFTHASVTWETPNCHALCML